MVRIIPINDDADIVKVCSVINMAFLTVANELGYTKETVPTFPAFIGKNTIINQINNGLKLFGLLLDNSLVGSIGIKKENTEGLFKIERLAIIPAYRHKKYGKMLMDYALNEIHNTGGKIAEVEIVNENLKLKKWYLNQGFREIRIDTYQHLPFTVGVLDINI